MMQQLKARQLGVTTLTELAVAHRVQFHPRVNAVVASADPKKSVKMATMIDFCWKSQPWWLLPKATKIEHGMPVEFGELDWESHEGTRPALLKSLEERVRNRGMDLVLILKEFVGHLVPGRLRPLCEQYGIPCLMVEKGYGTRQVGETLRWGLKKPPDVAGSGQ